MKQRKNEVSTCQSTAIATLAKEKSMTASEKPKEDKPWIAWLALVIAIVGGIPGLISTVDHFKRNSLRVHFNGHQSIACGFQTENSRLTNKLAIVLYEINVTGEGLQPTYIRDLRIEAKISDNWIVGTHIIPKLFTDTNFVGDATKSIHIKTKNITPPLVTGPTMILQNWREKWNEIGTSLQYGQPLNFSYAAHFDVDQSEFRHCDQLKLIATDYLGLVRKRCFFGGGAKMLKRPWLLGGLSGDFFPKTHVFPVFRSAADTPLPLACADGLRFGLRPLEPEPLFVPVAPAPRGCASVPAN